MSFVRVEACSLPVHLGKMNENKDDILKILAALDTVGHPQVVVFPELCLTGATLGDLFLQRDFVHACMGMLRSIACKVGERAVVVGLPVEVRGRVYNCAAVLKDGRVQGLVPKTCLTNEEMRWFVSGEGVREMIEMDMGTEKYQVEVNPCMLFDAEDFTFGVCVGEDIWSPDPRAARMALGGAEILLNPSAMNAEMERNAYRSEMFCQLSRRLHAGIVCANASEGESTADKVFDGFLGVFEDGADKACIAEIDVERLRYRRQRDGLFYRTPCLEKMEVKFIGKTHKPKGHVLGDYKRQPFVPEKEEQLDEIFEMQCLGLKSRLRAIRCEKLVIGVSGGLDSTLALLVAARVMDKLELSRENVIAITMPGMGTGARTKGNAHKLMQQLGVTALEIPIEAAVRQHFADIGQDENNHDVTYENAQARERTQILMDYANKVGGIVLGTGDLSESALGFCTYNGDHISMYNVNCGVPKTLARKLVLRAEAWFDQEVGATCRDVVETPVSPELLPTTEGELQQRTEDILGDYELLDFFLYHYLDSGADSAKLYGMAERAFRCTDYSEEEIEKALSTFWRRFHSQQFKRNCVPDGPQVTSISLSPRGAWSMPTDLQGW